MPIYEYQCMACGHHLEALQGFSESPLTECPSCHKTTLNKLVSAAGFQLKGSGWYVTDYSKKGKAKSETESTTKKTDGNNSSSSTDSGAASS